MARALFRCDASAQIGAGHVMRCLVFADALAWAGWSVTFATRRQSLAAAPALAASNNAIRLLEDDEDGADEAAQLAIVDHYGLDAAFERRLSGRVGRIVVFDDLANRDHACDVLLDPTPGRAPETYAPHVPASVRLLLGAKYALLGADWRHKRRETQARLAKGGAVKRILVLMGATDPLDTTSRVLAGLGRSGLDCTVDVVLGGGAPHRLRVERSLGPRMTLHIDPADLPGLAAEAELAIGAAGSSSFERALLGLPAILVAFADNQQFVAAAFAAKGAAKVVPIEMLDDADAFGKAVAALAADGAGRAAMSHAAASMTDGRGALRLLAEIAGALSLRDGARVRLRAADESDENWLLGLQSEPGLRRYFRNPALPSAAEHRAWLEKTLGDDSRFLTIVEVNGSAAGMLRLDRERSDGVRPVYGVSIAVAAAFQQRGVGRAALALARCLAPEAVFEATVMPENIGSIGLFRAAGYRHVGSGMFRSEVA